MVGGGSPIVHFYQGGWWGSGVLVGKAALYGFATCAACFLVIIAGLGATLVLLSVFRKALPALPISIGLGVLFYLLTRVAIIPYIDALVSAPIYV